MVDTLASSTVSLTTVVAVVALVTAASGLEVATAATVGVLLAVWAIALELAARRLAEEMVGL